MADIDIVKTRPGQEDEKGLEIHLNEKTLQEQSKNARDLFSSLVEELNQMDDDLKDGLSFLDMKNDTLLSYMIDICNIFLRKVKGEKIEGHQSVERCIEYRVILEKVKAIDQKLSYQLNKLITLPDEADEEDEKIDVRNLDINLDDDDNDNEEDSNDEDDDEDDDIDKEDDSEEDGDEDDEDEEGDNEEDNDVNDESDIEDVDDRKSGKEIKRNAKKSSKQIYKPPKLKSVAYLEEGRRKNYDEFYQDDAEVNVDSQARKIDKARVRFEEDNYTRLPDENPKKLKRKLKTKEYKKKGNNNKFKRRR